MKAIERDVGKIYVVVNNAGGVSTRPFHMETMERFWYQVELNFKAVRNFAPSFGLSAWDLLDVLLCLRY